MDQLLWTQKQDIGPSARSFVQMTYHAKRSRVVLFGGGAADNSTFLNDTWEWNGQDWTQVSDIGPSVRSRHALAYDSKRQRVILFGGVGGGTSSLTFLNDTWEWDGSDWTQVADTGPGPRAGHSMVYDSKRERVVLFGGNANNACLADTWAWDGTDWTQEQDAGPTPRTCHGMCFDTERGRIVLFGGESFSFTQVTETVKDGGIPGAFGATHTVTNTVLNTLFLDDTWEYDGLAWTRVADTGPEARIGAGLIYNGKTSLLFGGWQNNNAFKNTWEWDGKHWTQRQDIGPAGRGFAGSAFDISRERFVVFGGSTPTQTFFADTWEQFWREV